MSKFMGMEIEIFLGHTHTSKRPETQPVMILLVNALCQHTVRPTIESQRITDRDTYQVYNRRLLRKRVGKARLRGLDRKQMSVLCMDPDIDLE